MGILSQLFRTLTGHSDHADPAMLREICHTYIDEWPENNESYTHWKPDTVLPAPKWVVKRAMKLCYAEWPEPIDWTVYSFFFTEFADLALHLPADDYAQIESFRKGRIVRAGLEREHPLLTFTQSSTLAIASTIQYLMDDIVRIRDGVRRSRVWDPIDAGDNEVDNVRRILLESAVEFGSLTQEWRFYILSIGREKYEENAEGQKASNIVL